MLYTSPYHCHAPTRCVDAPTVHAFVDGLVLFGAFSASNEVGSRVGFAIVLHKLPDGFVLATVVAEVAAKTVGRKKAGIGRRTLKMYLQCSFGAQ